MEPPTEPRTMSTSELADELHHLLLECRRDPRLHEVMQALVLMSIGEVAHSDLGVDLEPGESIAGTLRNFWRIAYVEGFEDGLKGGADGNR
jgi:hypothetical protein